MLPKDVALPSVPFVFFFKTVAASFRRKLEQWHAFNDCSICSSRVPDVFGGQCQGAYDHPGLCAQCVSLRHHARLVFDDTGLRMYTDLHRFT